MTAYMSIKYCLCILLTFCWMSVASAALRHANPAGDIGAGNCTSTANACNLQQAMDAANPGDFVLLACGSYRSSSGFRTNDDGEESQRITMCSSSDGATCNASAKWCAKLKADESWAEGTNHTILVDDHSYWTFKNLEFDGRKNNGDVAVWTPTEVNRVDNKTTRGHTFEHNYVHHAGATLSSGAKGVNSKTRDISIRYNRFVGCGLVPRNGEAFYWGASANKGTPTPSVHGVVRGNYFGDYVVDGIDSKPQGDQSLALDINHNIFEHQVFRGFGHPEKRPPGAQENVISLRQTNTVFRNNIIRNNPATPDNAELGAGGALAVRPRANILASNNVLYELKNLKNAITPNQSDANAGLANSVIEDNTFCGLNDYGRGDMSGVTVQDNPGLPGGRPQSECNAEVARILSEEPLLAAVAGLFGFISGVVTAADPNKVVMTFNTGGFPPLLPATGITGWTFTKAGVNWPISGGTCSRVSASGAGREQVTCTMTTSATGGQAILGTYALSGNLTNSANPPIELSADTYAIENQVATSTPTISNLTVENAAKNVVRVTVDPAGGSMVPATGVTGFSCRKGLSATSAASWTINSASTAAANRAHLIMATPLNFGEYFDCSYALTGNWTNGTTELAAFTNRPGINNVLPVTPLEFVDAVVRDTDKDAIVFTLDANGNPPIFPASGGTGWTCTKEAVAWTIESWTRTAPEQFTLDMLGDAANGDDIECLYTAGTATPTTTSASELPGATYAVRNEVGAAPGTATLTQSDCICAELREDDKALFSKNASCRVKISPDGTAYGGTFFGMCAVKATVAASMGTALKWVGDDDDALFDGDVYDITSSSALDNRIEFGDSGRRPGCSVLADNLLQPAGSTFLGGIEGGRILNGACVSDIPRTITSGSHVLVGGLFRVAPGGTAGQITRLRLEHADTGADLTAYTNVLTIIVDEAEGMQ